MLCRWNRNHVHGAWSNAPRAAASTLALTLALVLACGACRGSAGPAPLTPADIAESGTLVLEAPRQAVLEACVLALRKQGYAIDVAEPETGLVITHRRPAEPGTSPGARLFRAYVVEVKDRPRGRVEVSAWPAVSEADTPRGSRPFRAPAWDLGEERAAWARLFEDVHAIVERASP